MKSNSIPTVIDEYLNELLHIKRYSNKTIISYRIDLIQFSDYITEKCEVNSLDRLSPVFLKRFVMHLHSQDLKKSSIARKIVAVRNFLSFAAMHNIIPDDYAYHLPTPKVKRKLPEVLKKSEFEQVLKQVDDSTDTLYTTVLTKLIFELLYGCSLRVSELCSLQLQDIDRVKGFISVTGKGNKTRSVPVGMPAIILINEYSKLRNSDCKTFLVQESGNPIYPRFVQRLVKSILGNATELTKKSPHILRHSSATHMLDNDADIIAIQKILGHENLSTTQIYTRVSVERLKSVYKKTHPKS